jgi:uroporphyrinogen-III decarboxylase
MSFAEDMSYNHGPMISEDLFNGFLLPYYHKVIPHLKERGIWTFLDSDGDISTAIPWFKNAGLDAIFPLERQAGVDVAQIRKDHPTFRMMGAFDKMTMNKGEAAMRKEFERLIPVAQKGGLIIGCDHQTPPGVSLEDYRLYLKLFREYAAMVEG